MSVMSCCFLQVHCVALLQGVQEGGEMNSPLQFKERQLWHQKIPKTLGLFFFSLSLFICQTCRWETIQPTTSGEKQPTFSIKILEYFSLTNLQSFPNMKNTTYLFITIQAANVRCVFGAHLRKKRNKNKCCWRAWWGKRTRKITELGTQLDFPPPLVETLRSNDFNCLVELLVDFWSHSNPVQYGLI